jgi:hypothetical protein
MNQREWVEGCLNWYKEADLTPGNPEDGEWHECHYPVPKCLGGTETIKLLAQHHAVQGVLQSEDYQHCCLFNWELKYLEGELLALAKKWKRNLISSNAISLHARRTPEERSRLAKERMTVRSPEARRESERKRQASMTPEERSAASRKGWLAPASPGGRPGRVAVVVESPDGSLTHYPSLDDAARGTGLTGGGVKHALKTGRATRSGLRFRTADGSPYPRKK